MTSPAVLPERVELSPLTDATRSERRALLLVTIIVVAVFYGGFMPAQIEQLGIEFAAQHQIALNTLLLFVQVYLLAEFTLHARVEKLAWRRYIVKVRAQALPSLRPLLGKLDLLTTLRDAAKLRRLVRDVSAAVDEIQSFLNPTTLENATAAIVAYENLAQMFSHRKSLNDNPDHELARLLLEGTNLDEILDDIDRIRQPEYSWHELGPPQTRRQAQRYLNILVARLLAALEEGKQFHGVAGRHVERIRRQILRRAEIVAGSIHLAFADLNGLWREYLRLIPTHVRNQPYLQIVASDIRSLGAYAATETIRRNPGDELSWRESTIIRGVIIAPAAFSDLEKSVGLAFSRIGLRAWFDFDLPSLIGAFVFVAACARILLGCLTLV